MASTGGSAMPLKASLADSLADPLRSLKQPLANGWQDVVAYLRISAAKRRHLRNGEAERALEQAARLVTGVQFARESLGTYRTIERLIDRFPGKLGEHRPSAVLPEQLVLFVGQSRSGHSLVGSLIDAHPDAVIAHEIHAFKHLLNGANVVELARAIRLNAHLFDLLGRSYTGYDYQVPGQWQGRARRPVIVGDKKGNGTTRLLRRHPGRLAEVEADLPVPLRFINVVRNPFDNIATKARRTGVSVAEAARRFLANADTLDKLANERPDQVKTIHLDELIDKPDAVLADLVDWLGLSPDVPGYVEACASLIFERPKRTRDQVAWPSGLIDTLKRRLNHYADLARYADEAGGAQS